MHNLAYAAPALRADPTFMTDLVKECPGSLRWASDTLKKNPDVVLAALRKDDNAISEASDELYSVRAFVLQAVTIYGCSLRFAFSALRNDAEIVTAAIQQNKAAIQFASVELRQLMLLTLKKYIERSNDTVWVKCKIPETVLAALCKEYQDTWIACDLRRLLVSTLHMYITEGLFSSLKMFLYL